MKRLLSLIMLAATTLAATAQETYMNAELTAGDLSGTARYVGMGGAMDALGVDISTINSNPAGIGMARKSSISVSASNLAFEQAGALFTTRINSNHYFNVAFNYQRTKNYRDNLSASGTFNGMSQNKAAYNDLVSAVNTGYDDWLNLNTVTQLDALYYYTLNGDTDGYLYYNDATRYTHSSETRGHVDNYDICFAGNVARNVYLGITLSVKDLYYRSTSVYTEQLVDADNSSIGSITVKDKRYVSGAGFDFRLGAVVFPIEDNPLRFGATIATPTWYDLASYNYTTLTNNASTGGDYIDSHYYSEGDYSYRVYTPWRFGLSTGYTIGRDIALGVSYEYADYSSTSTRQLDEDIFWDYVGSYKDEEMNDHTQKTLRGVHTLKVGGELKIDGGFAIRAGYNFVSAEYAKDGARDTSVDSPGTYFSSRADYINWGATNRVTCGAGWTNKSWAVDLAYQYTTSSGDYYPCVDADATSVSFNRHKLEATLTYKF